MSCARMRLRVTRVSSAATSGTSLSTRKARKVMSSRLPMGVATRYSVPKLCLSFRRFRRLSNAQRFGSSEFPELYDTRGGTPAECLFLRLGRLLRLYYQAWRGGRGDGGGSHPSTPTAACGWSSTVLHPPLIKRGPRPVSVHSRGVRVFIELSTFHRSAHDYGCARECRRLRSG